MAFKNKETNWSMLPVLFIVFQFIYHVSSNYETTKESWDKEPKGTIKTIKIDDGEIIDCVDIYKQPAFDNPLIKDLQPSDYPFGFELDSNLTIEMFQDWHKYGECPEGTIPIRRNKSSYNLQKSSPIMRQQINQSLDTSNMHEYAIVSNQGGSYYGASGVFNLWNPKTNDYEFSLSQMWVLSSQDNQDFYNNLNSIEVGWTVNPILYHDNRTRLFVYWTRDGYKNTGCFDLNCNGFVQTNRKFSFGMPIRHISTYGGQSTEVLINIFKNQIGDWWLQVHDFLLGYWPASILPNLSNHANLVEWGGEITNTRKYGFHTTTQMGSGQFPDKGFSKSSYIRNLKVLDDGLNERDPENLQKVISKPTCYDLTLTQNSGESSYETYIFFGGPGFSPICQQ